MTVLVRTSGVSEIESRMALETSTSIFPTSDSGSTPSICCLNFETMGRLGADGAALLRELVDHAATTGGASPHSVLRWRVALERALLGVELFLFKLKLLILEFQAQFLQDCYNTSRLEFVSVSFWNTWGCLSNSIKVR